MDAERQSTALSGEYYTYALGSVSEAKHIVWRNCRVNVSTQSAPHALTSSSSTPRKRRAHIPRDAYCCQWSRVDVGMFRVRMPASRRSPASGFRLELPSIQCALETDASAAIIRRHESTPVIKGASIEASVLQRDRRDDGIAHVGFSSNYCGEASPLILCNAVL
jgi:hypothetical protein